MRKHGSAKYFTIPEDSKISYKVYTSAELKNVYMEIGRNVPVGIKLEELLNMHGGRYNSISSLTKDLVTIYSIELLNGDILNIRCIDDLIQIGTGVRIIKE